MKSRNYSIDILKVIAVLTVLNSHMEVCYGNYSVFATGGAIGDALFFFCSGFTIFWGGQKSFPNFYKKRIARIYPAVVVISILSAIILSRPNKVIDDLVLGGSWFVNCIMIYYVFLWFVKRYLLNSLKWIWFVVAIIVIGSYYLFFNNESQEFFLYGDTYYKWVFFFLFMLYGGYVGINYERYLYSRWSLLKLVGCVTLWYSFFILGKSNQLIIEFQYLSILPLLGIVHYLYIICCHPKFIKIAESNIWGEIIFVVGGLCLECYLIQYYFGFTDKLNSLFPLNIPMIMIFMLGCSYVVNFLSNVLSQTFKSEEFDFNKLYLHRIKTK